MFDTEICGNKPVSLYLNQPLGKVEPKVYFYFVFYNIRSYYKMPKEEKKVKEGKRVKKEKHEKQGLAVSVLYPCQSRFAYKTDNGALFVINFKLKNDIPNTITYVVRLFLRISENETKFIKEFSFNNHVSDHKIIKLIQEISNKIFSNTPDNYEKFNEKVSERILRLPFVKTKGTNPSVSLIGVPVGSTAPQSGLIINNYNETNINYNTTSTTTACVIGNTLNTATSVTIPDTIEDSNGNLYTVTSIGNGPNTSGAFQSSPYLTSITLPYTIQNISNGGINFSAFTNCINLTNVTFSGTPQITSIGQYAFNYCSGLKTISVPNSVTNIGEYAFGGCTSLTSAILPQNSGFTTINYGTFAVCKNLSTVTIYNCVTSINFGFPTCTKLQTNSTPYQGTIYTDSVYGDYVYDYFVTPGNINGFYVNINNI
jgi:hypothetical protein